MTYSIYWFRYDGNSGDMNRFDILVDITRVEGEGSYSFNYRLWNEAYKRADEYLFKNHSHEEYRIIRIEENGFEEYFD